MKYFKGLIHCTICDKNKNKNYVFKKNRNTLGFICSGYKNYGKEFCNYRFLHLDMLLQIIEKHCELNGKDWELSKAKLFIHSIKVGEDEIKIMWKDGLVSVYNCDEVIF